MEMRMSAVGKPSQPFQTSAQRENAIINPSEEEVHGPSA